MPLYEYQCDACGHRFEVIQKFSDVPLETCPKCGGTVHKMQSAPAFHLKGSGWYATDYAKKDQSSSAKSEGDARESKDSGSATKDAAATSDKPSGTSASTSTTPTPATASKDKSDKSDRADKSDRGGKSDSGAKADKPA